MNIYKVRKHKTRDDFFVIAPSLKNVVDEYPEAVEINLVSSDVIVLPKTSKQ